jgi:hypothetical protein
MVERAHIEPAQSDDKRVPSIHSRPAPPHVLDARGILELQRLAGNKAVSALISAKRTGKNPTQNKKASAEHPTSEVVSKSSLEGTHLTSTTSAVSDFAGPLVEESTILDITTVRTDTAAAVQRQRTGQPKAANTLTWETEDASKDDKARFHRTTKIEADAWGEVGPAPPRINYDRRVHLWTSDGITAYLRILVTIYLDPSERLPKSPDEAFRTIGRAARGGWDFSAEGGDLIPVSDGKGYERRSPISMQSLATGFPDYALWPLSAKDHAAALLRHIATLKRRKLETTGGSRSVDTPKDKGKSKLTELARQGADLITDFVPGVSNMKDFVTFLTGVNPVTGEKVGWLGRLIALVFAIPGVGNFLKYAIKGPKAAVKILLRPFLKIGAKIASKSEALIKWLGKTRFGRWLSNAPTEAKGVWNRARERAGRVAEKLGLTTARIGHAKPYNQMTVAERKAFQHSYGRHGAEFNLPNWSATQAESLRQKFNSAVGVVRENAQKVTLSTEKVKGVSTACRYFHYTDAAGIRWYYYETLAGDFVSAGMETRAPWYWKK